MRNNYNTMKKVKKNRGAEIEVTIVRNQNEASDCCQQNITFWIESYSIHSSKDRMLG